MLTRAIIKQEIKRIRSQYYLSYRKIAQDIGISFATIMRLMHKEDEGKFTLKTMGLLQEYFKKMQ